MSANLNMARGTTAPTAHRLAGAGLVVPPAVRTASAVVGGLLLVGGMRRRSLGGAVMSLLGGAIVQQALLGRSTVAKAIGAVAGGATEDAAPRTYTVTRTATSLADAETIYALWRDPQALNEIFAGIAEVTVLDENRTHWEVTGPLGLGVAWTTIYTDVQPNAFLRWESLAGAPLTNGGSLTLRPAPERGTEIVLTLEVTSPISVGAGRVSGPLRGMARGFEARVLRNLKCLAEVGEVTRGRPRATCRADGLEV